MLAYTKFTFKEFRVEPHALFVDRRPNANAALSNNRLRRDPPAEMIANTA